MRYSFMSFSAPEAGFEQLISIAGKYGYDGIEPRIGSGHGHGIETGATLEYLGHVREVTEKKGVGISCIATSAMYSDPSTLEENKRITMGAIDLASRLNAPVIRVFGGNIPGTLKREESLENIVKSLKELAPHAAEKDVIIGVETHDDWVNPHYVKSIIEGVNHPNVMVNWDIMHPCLRGGFTIEESYNILKPYICHVHVHDGILEDNKLIFLPIGEGRVDHKKAIELLENDGYGGYISGEWIGWEPHDIHLPREIAALRSFES